MKLQLGVILTGSVLLLSAVAFGQASLKPNEFEAVKSIGLVDITAPDSSKVERVKIGTVYEMGDMKKVDPEAWAKGGGEPKVKPTIFKVTGMKGTARIHQPGHLGYRTPTIGATYPVGSTVKTERDSFLDLELSPRNVIRVLPLTEAVIGEKMRNPGLVSVRLYGGTTDVKLDDFPKDCKFQVSTPMAVCGAVGTAYRTFYDLNINNAMTFEVEVTDGEVMVFGTLIRVLEKPLHAGQSLRIEVTDQEDVRLIMARFTGKVGDMLKLMLWGREFHLLIAAPEGVDPNTVTQGIAQVTLRMARPREVVPPVIPAIHDFPSSPAGT